MYQDLPIQDIYAREILDSRGQSDGRSGDTCRGENRGKSSGSIRRINGKI